MTESSACPYCGNEMEKGFIVSNYGTWWNDHVPRLICRGGEKLASSFWFCSGIPGSKCTACGIIVLHSGKPKRFASRGTKCSHCGAVYVYLDEKIDEDGNVRCQNCDKEFLISDYMRALPC